MSVTENIIGKIARKGITWMSKRSLPQLDGPVSLQGLWGSVEVIRDKWGIPHIYAANSHDLFFAQGYVHAQDRLFQMEMNRRIAQGKLSELFGSLALDTDRTTRTFGFNRLGEVDWANATQDLRDMVIAYTAGVNAFLDDPSRKLPVEFTLLNHSPNEWNPEDTFAFARVMMWQLSHAWYSEIVRAQLAEAVGENHAAELETNYPGNNPITLPQGIEYYRLDNESIRRMVGGPFLDQGKGSNAWAISADKSATGHAILCNDMHLALNMPSLWYQVHLVSDEFNVMGVGLPGIPLVLIGHNAQIAWGITLAFTDCEDLYIEKFDPKDHTRYLYRDTWLQADVIPEPIDIKGNTEPYIEKVIVTKHGPIISEVIGIPEQSLAIHSMALQPCLAIQGWYMLNKASDWDDFVQAMHLIEAPQLNICYADTQDNIGYWVTGKVPIRAKGNGSVPAPGWTGEYEWVGEVPFEEMPHAFNPVSGYIVTCNHRIVDDNYPYSLGNVWMNGYRARRIVDFLESRQKISFEDHASMHTDFTCIPGMELARHVTALNTNELDVQLAQELLSEWDGQLTANCVGGTVYEVLRLHMVRNLFEPILGEELTFRVLGKGFHPILMPTHEFYGHDTVSLLRILDNPSSWWLEQTGGKDAILISSLKQTIEWLRENLGENPKEWRWGKLHKAIFAHSMSLRKPLDSVFNAGPFPIGGDTDTPCQTAYFAHDPYDNKAWAPSFRQIVDMGDLSRSVGITPPGQSGQLGSPHYDDLVQPWLTGEYHPLLWERDQVENQAEGKLILQRGNR